MKTKTYFILFANNTLVIQITNIVFWLAIDENIMNLSLLTILELGNTLYAYIYAMKNNHG